MTRKSTNLGREEIRRSLREANVLGLLIFLLLFGLPFVAVGLFFIHLGQRTMVEQARLNEDAIEVEATIVASDLRRSTTSTGPGVESRSTSYWPEVEFTYEHEGRIRTSRKVWALEEGGLEAPMRTVVDRYVPGMEMTAWVDPLDPANAFLEKRWSAMPYIVVGAGTLPIVFVTALGVWLTGWRRPGVALAIATVLGATIMTLQVVAGAHYVRVVPASERAWWVLLALIAVGAVSLAPMLLVRKAQKLSRIYREVLSSAEGIVDFRLTGSD